MLLLMCNVWSIIWGLIQIYRKYCNYPPESKPPLGSLSAFSLCVGSKADFNPLIYFSHLHSLSIRQWVGIVVWSAFQVAQIFISREGICVYFSFLVESSYLNSILLGQFVLFVAFVIPNLNSSFETPAISYTLKPVWNFTVNNKFLTS